MTNPALYNDKLVNQCAAPSGSPRDDKSSHYYTFELPLLQGKTAEDVASKRDGIGQLLLAMMAVFANYGEVVWGVALAPSKVNYGKPSLSIWDCYIFFRFSP